MAQKLTAEEKRMRAEERRYRAESDANILARALEIQNSPSRLKAATTVAKKQADALMQQSKSMAQVAKRKK